MVARARLPGPATGRCRNWTPQRSGRAWPVRRSQGGLAARATAPPPRRMGAAVRSGWRGRSAWDGSRRGAGGSGFRRPDALFAGTVGPDDGAGTPHRRTSRPAPARNVRGPAEARSWRPTFPANTTSTSGQAPPAAPPPCRPAACRIGPPPPGRTGSILERPPDLSGTLNRRSLRPPASPWRRRPAWTVPSARPATIPPPG